MGANPADMFAVSGKVGGAGPSSDGNYNALRQGKTLELIMSQAHGKYYEAASRGKLFNAVIGAAGVAPGTALSTAPAMIIHNPVNSGILVSIKRVSVGYLSGTIGAGMLVHSQNASQLTAPSGGTALVPVCSLLNGSGGTAKAYTGSTISATSTLIRPSLSLGAFLASEASMPGLMMDEVDGSIVIPAGVAYCYQGITAAGTTPLFVIGVMYEEISVP